MSRNFLLCCAVLFITNQVFADEKVLSATGASKGKCGNQGHQLEQRVPAAYNSAAAIDVVNKRPTAKCPVNVIVEGSYLYWLGGQEGLSLATSGVLNEGISYFPTRITTSYQPFEYKPGFKVGLGVIGDHQWVLYAEYTRVRGHSVANVQAPSNETIAGSTAPTTGTPVLVVNSWFLLGTAGGQAFAGTSLISSWRYGVDLYDVTVSRPYYEGRSVTVSPFAGLRAAVIRQNMVVAFTEAAGMFGNTLPALSTEPTQPLLSKNFSRSWGIGPRLGLEGNYLLDYGFRFEADAAGSLLYTRYTEVTHSETPASTAFATGAYKASLSDYGCVRPIVEFGLAFGWGQYLWCNDYHIDFLAAYDFTYLWNQNMIRKLLDDTLSGTSYSAGDLYLHGLTLTGRFDF